MTDSPPLPGLPSPVRNRYFYGKLLDAAHLQLEQDYFNDKRRLLNRLLAGAGVIEGLEVTPAGDGRVTVSPGVALDPTGREIIVPVVSDPVDPRQPTDNTGAPAGARLDGADTVTIGVAYAERATEPAPVYADSDDGEPASAPSLVTEGYRVVVAQHDSPPGVRLARVRLPDSGGAVTADGIEQVARRLRPGPQLDYSAGDAQTSDPATVLSQPVTALVRDGSGVAVPGVGVTFAVRGGGGALSADGAAFAPSVEVTSGADGAATASWRLGDRPGVGSVSATIAGAPPVTFIAFGLPAPGGSA